MADLGYAMIDRTHTLCPGLFRSLSNDDRKKRLDLRYKVSEDQFIEFKGPYMLGALELRVLQAIVAMAGPDGKLLSNDATASILGRELMRELFTPDAKLRRSKEKPHSLMVSGSLRGLLSELGMAVSGANIRTMRKSIETLFMVTVFLEKDGVRAGSRLLGSYASDEATGDLCVAINPLLAGAVLGHRQYTRIDLNEVRALKTDAAHLLHQRLCAWIDAGKVRKVSMEYLMSYAWPDPSSVESTIKKRKSAVRKALREFEAIGWQIVEKKGIFSISRPACEALGCDKPVSFP